MNLKESLKINIPQAKPGAANPNKVSPLPDGKRKPSDIYIDLGLEDDTGKESSDWGLLSQYLDVYSKGNVHTNALRWSFYALMGLVKGRDIWLNFGGKPLFPNLYIALVGDPGCGKSTAIIQAKNLAAELGYPSFTPEIIDPSRLFYYFQETYKTGMLDMLSADGVTEDMYARDKISFLSNNFKDNKEPMTQFNINNRFVSNKTNQHLRLAALNHDASGIWSSEFLGTIPPNAKWLVVKALTELYDAQDFSTYSPADSVMLKQPIINLLGGVTSNGLAKSFNAGDFNNGLLTRMVLVHVPNVDKADPFNQTHDFRIGTELLGKLEDTYANMNGEITITKGAQKLYKRISGFQFNIDYDIRLAFYYNRRQVTLIKLAMLTCMMHGRMEIIAQDIKAANTLLMYTEFDMPETLVDFAITASVKIRNTIISYLETRLRTHAETTSEMIINTVSQKLGISSEKPILIELKKLVDTKLVMMLPMAGHNTFSLDKPKNVDVIKAMEFGFVDISLIPEWNIRDYWDSDEEISELLAGGGMGLSDLEL